MTAEDSTEPLRGEEPAASGHPDDLNEPTENSGGGDAPTEKLGEGDERPTERLSSGDDTPTKPQEPWAPHQPEVKSGIGILIASILASLALIIGYIFAGGLDFKPAPVADPCDSRIWSDPTGLEDTAQQLAFSTLDGAACDLGVSREELTRALASDEATDEFLTANDISREQFDEAIRSGLKRAVDDAENAGAVNPLVASGIRTAIQFLPVSQLIPLLQEASSAVGSDSGLQDLLGGDVSGLGSLLEQGLGGLDGEGGQGSGPGNGPGGGSDSGGLSDLIPDDLGRQLRDQLPPEIERNLPEGIEDDLGRQLEQQIESLLGP